jgi:hypothetical protein
MRLEPELAALPVPCRQRTEYLLSIPGHQRITVMLISIILAQLHPLPIREVTPPRILLLPGPHIQAPQVTTDKTPIVLLLVLPLQDFLVGLQNPLDIRVLLAAYQQLIHNRLSQDLQFDKCY